ncbi:MAG TPA: hypothetical protein DCX32_00600 [Candidatus Moranbacteria bacterium]|nr:MAG: hypothetical protein UW87_C0006G0032 [Candidatus Moranbacteria bacterium GW2011_GWC2_45_10]KKT95556.1 MAG: NUDIX hydrolase [Parcubacteria group bacterium GW2011_GWC1_45_14]HAV11037.1 hypothetical protein [Candidatus Moranbacteria bacterium]
MHKSAGAIIKNDKGKILMLERTKFPFGWACPAGHVDEGEKPEDAMVREVWEETGLSVKEYELLFHEFVEWNECSRGVRGHDWSLFEAIEWEGEAVSNSESKNMKWVGVDEIKGLELEPVWKYWFEKLKII